MEILVYLVQIVTHPVVLAISVWHTPLALFIQVMDLPILMARQAQYH